MKPLTALIFVLFSHLSWMRHVHRIASFLLLATIPISQLRDHGYELHNIQLMQPTETSPVGLKLTKQQEPLQYIITAIAKGTKADFAGLKVHDWLIKIEDDDIRSVEFSEVSQNIRQLLTSDGLINMVVARKVSSSASPSLKASDQMQMPASSSRTDSFTRQQGGNLIVETRAVESVLFLLRQAQDPHPC